MSKKAIILFIVALLVIGGATFGGVYIFMSQNTEKEEVVVESFYEVGEVFVNLNDTDSRRYVKLNMSIGYDSKHKKLPEEIESKSIVIRDTVIYLIKGCVASDFNTENEEKLKASLVEAVNSKLTNGSIIDVYMSDIMVQ